jgi:hypothetical protein
LISGLTPNTAYELDFVVSDYARPVYWTAIEPRSGTGSVDDTEDGIADIAPYVNEKPIYARDVEDILVAGSEGWKHGSNYLLTWTGIPGPFHGSPSSTTSTTYVQHEHTDEFIVNVKWRGSRMRPDCPCVFAACLATDIGVGARARLVDADTGSQLAEPATVTTVNRSWVTAAFDLPRDTRAVKVEYKASATDIAFLRAFNVHQWMA